MERQMSMTAAHLLYCFNPHPSEMTDGTKLSMKDIDFLKVSILIRRR